MVATYFDMGVGQDTVNFQFQQHTTNVKILTTPIGHTPVITLDYHTPHHKIVPNIPHAHSHTNSYKINTSSLIKTF